MEANASFDLRVDQEVIANLVEQGSRILDLGCGDGALLEYLIRKKNARGFGVEISHEGIRACIDRGLPVLHADIDQGLSDHHEETFDYVILSDTLQAVRHPKLVLREMLRVGKKGIVSFHNFGHWRLRLGLALGGRMPKNRFMPYEWYDTPNIHPCTIHDFQELCQEMNIAILRRIPLSSDGARLAKPWGSRFSNLLAPTAIFLLEEKPT